MNDLIIGLHFDKPPPGAAFIVLTQGQLAIVDEEDYDRISSETSQPPSNESSRRGEDLGELTGRKTARRQFDLAGGSGYFSGLPVRTTPSGVMRTARSCCAAIVLRASRRDISSGCMLTSI